MKRFLAVLKARSMEFLRDRSTLGWSVIFPVLLVIGFAFVFSGPPKPMFKVGVLGDPGSLSGDAASFFRTKYIQFIPVTGSSAGIDKVSRFQLDMFVDVSDGLRYWISENSSNGYMLERILSGPARPRYQRFAVHGSELRYVDWVVPGILAMNMMFSCLFGVGYVIVRYRKNGFLKRLKATPLSPFEFLLAQMVSRLLLILVVTAGVYAGCNQVLHFQMRGSYLDLLIVATAGAVCMIALGLLVAARFSSEEVANGILNVTTWPMMLLSGVWFSLEGTNPVVVKMAQFLPLTHLVDGARAIMIQGATLLEVGPQLAALAAMTAIFLSIGSLIFRWE